MKNGSPESAGSSKSYWVAFASVCAFLCLPLLSVTYPPLVDYPNHLARAHVLYHYADVPAYQARYYKVLEPIPNLAIDLVVPVLLPFGSSRTVYVPVVGSVRGPRVAAFHAVPVVSSVLPSGARATGDICPPLLVCPWWPAPWPSWFYWPSSTASFPALR